MAVLLCTLFLGFSCAEAPVKKKNSSETSLISCKSEPGAQLDMLPVLKADSVKKIERKIEQNGFKSSVEKERTTLAYAKYLWIGGNDLKSEYLLNTLIDSEDELSETTPLGWTYYNLGEIYYLRHALKRQNTANDAWSYHRKAKYFFQKTRDSIGLVKSLSRLGVLHERGGNIDSAGFYFNRAIDIAKKIDYKMGLSRPYTHLGLASLESGDTVKAQGLLEKVVEINTDCKNYEELPFSLVNKARLLSTTKPAKAKLEIQQAIKVSRTAGFKLAEINALFQLSRLAQETGDISQAISSYEEVVELSDRYDYSVYSEASKSLLERLAKD
ncbi:MAG: tetratricopeptide repeat protein [Flavobacteriaceae bacterium]